MHPPRKPGAPGWQGARSVAYLKGTRATSNAASRDAPASDGYITPRSEHWGQDRQLAIDQRSLNERPVAERPDLRRISTGHVNTQACCPAFPIRLHLHRGDAQDPVARAKQRRLETRQQTAIEKQGQPNHASSWVNSCANLERSAFMERQQWPIQISSGDEPAWWRRCFSAWAAAWENFTTGATEAAIKSLLMSPRRESPWPRIFIGLG